MVARPASIRSWLTSSLPVEASLGPNRAMPLPSSGAETPTFLIHNINVRFEERQSLNATRLASLPFAGAAMATSEAGTVRTAPDGSGFRPQSLREIRVHQER